MMVQRVIDHNHSDSRGFRFRIAASDAVEKGGQGGLAGLVDDVSETEKHAHRRIRVQHIAEGDRSI